jgi:ATP-binding cassette subfamily F protein uup
LSYQEKRDLEALPALIERLESESAKMHAEMADPDFYKQPAAKISSQHARLSKLEGELAVAFRRWEDLEKFTR